jgi:outer membrane protein OmpA-like peptidoglycan-associated protein
MKLTAKCSNFNGCLLAYRSEDILLDSDAPLVCPECEKVLTLLDTQDFQPRSKTWIFAATGICALAIVGGPLLWKKSPKKTVSAPELATSPTEPATASAEPVPTPKEPVAIPSQPAPALPSEKPAPSVLQTGSTPPVPPPQTAPIPAETAIPTVSEPAPPPPTPPKPQDQRDPVTEKYRPLLLEKADQLKNLSLESRESLIASLEATRKISKLTTVPVQFGIQKLPPPALALLKPAVDSADVRALIEKSPSPVFVVLGYADASGDTSKNAVASQSRADLVASALREKLPKKTPVYPIAMGSSHLPAPDKLDENRVAEIWVIFP